MIDQQRTQGDVFAEIVNGAAARIADGVPLDPAVESKLWYELGRLAARDRTVPAWAQVAAMMLGDKWAAEAKLPTIIERLDQALDAQRSR